MEILYGRFEKGEKVLVKVNGNGYLRQVRLDKESGNLYILVGGYFYYSTDFHRAED